jgi:hypothetical protein
MNGLFGAALKVQIENNTYLSYQNNTCDSFHLFIKIDESIMLQEGKLTWTSPTLSFYKHVVNRHTITQGFLSVCIDIKLAL